MSTMERYLDKESMQGKDLWQILVTSLYLTLGWLESPTEEVVHQETEKAPIKESASETCEDFQAVPPVEEDGKDEHDKVSAIDEIRRLENEEREPISSIQRPAELDECVDEKPVKEVKAPHYKMTHSPKSEMVETVSSKPPSPKKSNNGLKWGQVDRFIPILALIFIVMRPANGLADTLSYMKQDVVSTGYLQPLQKAYPDADSALAVAVIQSSLSNLPRHALLESFEGVTACEVLSGYQKPICMTPRKRSEESPNEPQQKETFSFVPGLEFPLVGASGKTNVSSNKTWRERFGCENGECSDYLNEPEPFYVVWIKSLVGLVTGILPQQGKIPFWKVNDPNYSEKRGDQANRNEAANQQRETSRGERKTGLSFGGADSAAGGSGGGDDDRGRDDDDKNNVPQLKGNMTRKKKRPEKKIPNLVLNNSDIATSDDTRRSGDDDSPDGSLPKIGKGVARKRKCGGKAPMLKYKKRCTENGSDDTRRSGDDDSPDGSLPKIGKGVARKRKCGGKAPMLKYKKRCTENGTPPDGVASTWTQLSRIYQPENENDHQHSSELMDAKPEPASYNHADDWDDDGIRNELYIQRENRLADIAEARAAMLRENASRENNGGPSFSRPQEAADESHNGEHAVAAIVKKEDGLELDDMPEGDESSKIQFPTDG